MNPIKLLAIVFVFFSLSCTKMKSDQNTVNKNLGTDVIYGQDDRLDFYQILDKEWLRLTDSTVAIMDKRSMELDEAGKNYSIDSDEYGKAFGLCLDERFYNQPSASFCSGFLVGPQVVITAGHCIRNKFNCENAHFVFGYHYKNKEQDLSQIPAKDVYSCQSIIHTQAIGNGADYGIIRLDRPVTDRSPVLVRTEGKINDDAALTVIGYPSGLPAKIADSGLIRENNNDDFFLASLDTYGGNSGSAVFNSETRLVEGILVRGNSDFVFDQDSRCRRSVVCKESACRGEDVVRIDVILNHLSPQELKPLPSQEEEP